MDVHGRAHVIVRVHDVILTRFRSKQHVQNRLARFFYASDFSLIFRFVGEKGESTRAFNTTPATFRLRCRTLSAVVGVSLCV